MGVVHDSTAVLSSLHDTVPSGHILGTFVTIFIRNIFLKVSYFLFYNLVCVWGGGI